MKRTARRSDCPVNFALQTFGDAWSLLIVRDLMFTDRRTYGDFLNAEEGIATNILANRLEMLQTAGIITKRVTGRGAEYALTEKGLDLLPAMLDLVAWSARYDEHSAAPADFVERIRTNRGGTERALRRQLAERYGIAERESTRARRNRRDARG